MKNLQEMAEDHFEFMKTMHNDFMKVLASLSEQMRDVNQWEEVEGEDEEEESPMEQMMGDLGEEAAEMPILGIPGISRDAPQSFPLSYAFTESMIDPDKMASGMVMGLPYELSVHSTPGPTGLMPIYLGMFHGE